MSRPSAPSRALPPELLDDIWDAGAEVPFGVSRAATLVAGALDALARSAGAATVRAADAVLLELLEGDEADLIELALGLRWLEQHGWLVVHGRGTPGRRFELRWRPAEGGGR